MRLRRKTFIMASGASAGWQATACATPPASAPVTSAFISRAAKPSAPAQGHWVGSTCQGCGEALGTRYASTCPACEDIQGWLFHAESGDCEDAWRHLTRDNPFPALMGRVYRHSCEAACNRGRIDAPVGINSVERFLGDEALKQGWRFTPPAQETGKHVLVVGGGPSGMSAAYQLRRMGHRVAVFEAGPQLGGMMRLGIPKYRLPRDVLDAEMQRSVELGVAVRLNTKVSDIAPAMQDGGFDAAFLAVGAHIGKRASIPAKDSSRILDAVAVLRSMEGAEQPMMGRRVIVYGGGNTAIDVARTAERLGATEAIIVYRRTRE